MAKPKAHVEIYVTYCGQEWEEEGECEPQYFYDDLADVVAGIDYEVREAARKRETLKEKLRS